MVAVGQIWEYRKSADKHWKVPDRFLYKREAVFHTKMAWEIIHGEFRGEDLFWTAKVVRDEDGSLDITNEFSEDVFESGERFRLIYDPAQDADVYCTQCGRLFPYAIWKPKFECWGCVNGF